MPLRKIDKKLMSIVRILLIARTLPLKILSGGIKNADGNAADTIMSSVLMERWKAAGQLQWLGRIVKDTMKTVLGFALLGGGSLLRRCWSRSEN